MNAYIDPKPFKAYSDLVNLLMARRMSVADPTRAERKLAQVGYYRLSGFWFPCREFKRNPAGQVIMCPNTGRPLREDYFTNGTTFEAAFELYLFDKRLRQAMLDAIERIEIHVRSIIAHEVGYHDPMAYSDVHFIRPRDAQTFTDARGKQRNIWAEWLKRHGDQVSRSQEDCIVWHRTHNKAMPFWVVVEAWDFGMLSKYFEILKGSYQNKICSRLGISHAKALKTWLQQINTLRNRCAHHTRIWNQVSANALPIIQGDPYFDAVALDVNALTRLYGLVAVLWYLVKKIGPSSQWIRSVADIVDAKPTLPGCSLEAFGLSADQGRFPQEKFEI